METHSDVSSHALVCSCQEETAERQPKAQHWPCSGWPCKGQASRYVDCTTYYVYMYVHTCTYIHTCTCTYIHTYMYIHVHTCTCACSCVYKWLLQYPPSLPVALPPSDQGAGEQAEEITWARVSSRSLHLLSLAIEVLTLTFSPSYPSSCWAWMAPTNSWSVALRVHLFCIHICTCSFR